MDILPGKKKFAGQSLFALPCTDRLLHDLGYVVQCSVVLDVSPVTVGASKPNGIPEEGQEIAMKRLLKTSKQGLDDIEEREMLMIYEFKPNKCLDLFIFDEVQSKLLDWPKRYNIINGVAKGLLYLHRDS
ncbi:hypothetical protein POM88_013937 [Heracleum sosnowskyi]|uniref:Protein kinase domain-containing protein n=1 Tax=Heracleum sosnowskyi TaxID=360622 RepID=A0AAD8J059_9APIA|nr:hypothetical protein POM88_013937 [Heracleum sosnowskyi]